MLAAASPDRDGALGTLKVILHMEASGQKYSASLAHYLASVIEQSLHLAEEPEQYSGDAEVEALSLALHVKSDEELKAALQEILTNSPRKSERAGDALRSLESRFDTQCEPSHFSSGVYAAL